MKIRPVGTHSIRMDRQTDRHDKVTVIVAFQNFANGPKNAQQCRQMGAT
jgi:hypothetical protein